MVKAARPRSTWKISSAAFIDCDHAFHSKLYEVSGRERLTRMIAELQDRSGRYLPHLYRAWEAVENPLESHRPLLEAIRARDAGLIGRLTREHMEQAADRLIAAVAHDAEQRRWATDAARMRPGDAGGRSRRAVPLPRFGRPRARPGAAEAVPIR